MVLLAFLFPLAVYCLILAFVNRSPHPVFVSGRWDFVGWLFATSGFLLLGGPAILNGVYEQRRLAWAIGAASLLPGGWDENWYFWSGLWLFYFAVVLGGASLVLWRRERMTSIYNVEPRVFDNLLAEVLQRLNLPWTRTGGHIAIGPPEAAEQQQASPVSARVDAFPAFRHVSLYWTGGDEGLRAAIEEELRKALADVNTIYNPVGTWLLSISASLFSATFFGMVLFVLGLLINVQR